MSIYKRKNSPYWWMCYKGRNGQQVRESTHQKFKEDARAALRSRQNEIDAGIYAYLPRRDRILFSDIVKQFKNEYRGRRGVLSESSKANYELLLEKVNGHFGALSIERISDSDVDEYINQRKQDTVKGRGRKVISHFTINRELGVLRLVLNWAKTKRKIACNPIVERLSGVNLPKEEPRKRFFSDAEISALLAAANEAMRQFILIAINAGMRLEEITGLRWNEIDLAASVIHLPPERTKTKTGRDIPMNGTLVKLFEQLKLKRGENVFVFQNLKTKRPYNKCLSNTWKRLLKKAGVQPGRFHDLRRTFITRAAQMGASVKDIQVVVGHKDPMTTMRVYLQATESGMRRVVDLANFSEPSGEVIDMPKVAQKGS